MMDAINTLSADWVAPVSVPPIKDGIVSFVNGRLCYLGIPDGRAIDEHFDRAIILPGLVNAHSHLDLTGAASKTPPRLPFPDWLCDVIEFRRKQSHVITDIANGVQMCLASGTTLIGDIAGCPESVSYLSSLPLRRVAFFELIGLSPDRCAQALENWRAAAFIPAGPHAPYSFHKNGLAEVIGQSPLLTVHLAESRDEKELLEHHTGPFVEFLKSLGVWHPEGLVASWNAVLVQLRDCHPIIVHGNYLEPELPFPKNGTLVYCPRTHAAFGHEPHPFRRFLERGIRVVIGTDSLASNPDLSVLTEARFVAKVFPDIDSSTLLHMITDWPAQALMMDGQCGSLAVGKLADLTVIELPQCADPLRTLFQDEKPVRAVYVGGNRAV